MFQNKFLLGILWIFSSLSFAYAGILDAWNIQELSDSEYQSYINERWIPIEENFMNPQECQEYKTLMNGKYDNHNRSECFIHNRKIQYFSCSKEQSCIIWIAAMASAYHQAIDNSQVTLTFIDEKSGKRISDIPVTFFQWSDSVKWDVNTSHGTFSTNNQWQVTSPWEVWQYKIDYFTLPSGNNIKSWNCSLWTSDDKGEIRACGIIEKWDNWTRLAPEITVTLSSHTGKLEDNTQNTGSTKITKNNVLNSVRSMTASQQQELYGILIWFLQQGTKVDIDTFIKIVQDIIEHPVIIDDTCFHPESCLFRIKVVDTDNKPISWIQVEFIQWSDKEKWDVYIVRATEDTKTNWEVVYKGITGTYEVDYAIVLIPWYTFTSSWSCNVDSSNPTRVTCIPNDSTVILKLAKSNGNNDEEKWLTTILIISLFLVCKLNLDKDMTKKENLLIKSATRVQRTQIQQEKLPTKEKLVL